MELLILILAVVIAFGILVWMLFMLAGEYLGAAYVPTEQKEIEEILEKLNLKPGAIFYDLGSGDGRVVFTAAEKYKVKGTGIEINPWLILWSRLTAARKNLKEIKFLRKNFWQMNLAHADCVYFYQSPKAAERLGEKMQKQGKPGAIIVSKAFEIKKMKNKQIREQIINERKYYIYKI